MIDDTLRTARHRPLRFAVVGAGVIGEHHARVVSELGDAELVAVVDRTEGKARKLAERYDADPMVRLDDALARADVDGIAVCTPSGIHAEQAAAALEAGKHVIVEKPVDVSLRAAERLAEAEARSPALATVISQHRFDPSSLAVHEAVSAGRLGVVTSGVATVSWWRSQAYYDSGGWRGTWNLDGGGSLMNQSIHTLDLLVWMLGRPVEVTGQTARLAHTDIEVEDTAVATVRFEGGALGVVHATTAAYPGLTARLQVHGSHGSAVIDDDRLTYFHAQRVDPGFEAPAYGARAAGNQVSLLPEAGDGTGPTAGSDPGALSDAHRRQYVDFIEAIRSGRTPSVTVVDACTTLAVVLAIYRSAAQGRPVPVSPVSGSA